MPHAWQLDQKEREILAELGVLQGDEPRVGEIEAKLKELQQNRSVLRSLPREWSTSYPPRWAHRFVRLSEANQIIPDLHAAKRRDDELPGFAGIWCKYVESAGLLAQMQNVLCLVHGPLHCAAAARNYLLTSLSLYQGTAFTHLPTTSTMQQQIIMGEDSHLEEALVQVDEVYRPSLIVVLNTCAPGITGEDIAGKVASVRRHVKAAVLVMKTEGFLSCWQGVSMSACMEKMAELIDPPSRVDPLVVNLLGLYREVPGYRPDLGERGWLPRQYPADVDELSRLVEGLDLRVHRILLTGDLEYLRSAGSAGTNAMICSGLGQPMARAMEDRFGTRSLTHSFPAGVTATERWLRELAAATNREEAADRFCREEYSAIEGIWQRAKEAVRGKVALVDAGKNSQNGVPLSLAIGRMCADLGMEVYHLNLHPQELRGWQDEVDYFLSDGYDPQVLYGPHDFQRPTYPASVIDHLRLSDEEVVYVSTGIYPAGRSADIDASHVARVDCSTEHMRVRGAPGHGIGFRGSAAFARELLEAIAIARRQSKPTLYARLYGPAL